MTAPTDHCVSCGGDGLCPICVEANSPEGTRAHLALGNRPPAGETSPPHGRDAWKSIDVSTGEVCRACQGTGLCGCRVLHGEAEAEVAGTSADPGPCPLCKDTDLCSGCNGEPGNALGGCQVCDGEGYCMAFSCEAKRNYEGDSNDPPADDWKPDVGPLKWEVQAIFSAELRIGDAVLNAHVTWDAKDQKYTALGQSYGIPEEQSDGVLRLAAELATRDIGQFETEAEAKKECEGFADEWVEAHGRKRRAW